MLPCRNCITASDGSRPAIAIKKIGTVRTCATQNRRCMANEFGVWSFLGRGLHRLQGHAALGACSGAVLNDLRVHRAGVFAAATDADFDAGLADAGSSTNCCGAALNFVRQ